MSEEENKPVAPPVQPTPAAELPKYYAQPMIAPAPNPMERLIPTKNSNALIAYYLGVFSLIPCLGIPLAVGAIILGNLGLKAVRQNKDMPGKTHAIVGIVLGSIMLLANIAAIVAIAIAASRPT